MLLQVKGLSKDFRLRSGLLGRSTRLHAVTDVSFTLAAAGSLAIVGETGSGKTTVARIIVALESATRGDVVADGVVLSPSPGPSERRHRARMMQMVFQNPVLSLDPHQEIGRAIHEVVAFHGLRPPSGCDDRVAELMAAVGLDAKLAAEALGPFVVGTSHHHVVIELPQVMRQRLGQKIGVVHANSHGFNSANGHECSCIET